VANSTRGRPLHQSSKPKDCALTLRADGRYCRKVRGGVRYFELVDDPTVTNFPIWIAPPPFKITTPRLPAERGRDSR
jgi:hypothetical protein